jgi:hypothetical protein
MLELTTELAEEAKKILSADCELYDLAVSEGIEYAGLSLNRRVEPDVDHAAEPPYWQRVKTEVRKLLCTEDKAYVELRKKMKQTKDAGDRVGVPAITDVVAHYVGLETALITPFVSLLLVSITQISIGAWCSNEASGKQRLRKLSSE